jgi:two-component system, OmpR family, sensor kinase
VGRLFWKFFIAFWVTLVVVAFGVGSTVSLYNRMQDESADVAYGPRAVFMVNTAAATVKFGGMPALLDLMAEWRGNGGAHVFVVDAAGRELLGRPVAPTVLEHARELATAPGGSREARLVNLPEGGELLLFVPARKQALHDRILQSPPHTRPQPAVPVIIGLLVSLVLSALLAWYLARPIRNLKWAFDAVAAGKLETRVGHLMKRRDEIADLGRDFDHMAQQLQILITAQRRLLNDVSHELRSPLARMQAAIGLARQNPERLEATLDRIEHESARLDQLVGELLTLSRLEAGTSTAPSERVELVGMVAAIADDAHFEAQASGREVAYTGEGEVFAEVRAELLYRAFENIIRNAVKYTAPGSSVEVRAISTRDRFTVIVADRGPGVPEGDLDAIFEPFYRSENGQSATGFGLGLAIAKRAVEAHGGCIKVTNRAGGGLRVEIQLPILKAV